MNLEQCNPRQGSKTKYIDSTDTSIDIVGLHAYTTYMVFVQASNADGFTENSTSAVTGIIGENWFLYTYIRPTTYLS